MCKEPIVNKSGRINIKRVGSNTKFWQDWYHQLMKMSWSSYLCFFVISYLLINSIFASFYYIVDDSIVNATYNTYWEAWAFSFQTSSTLGYGYLLPKSAFAHIIVIFDVISGILFVAFATGLAFTRFSRPTSKVLFSKNMIIGDYDGQKHLMFRLANLRSSKIVNAKVSVVALLSHTTKEGMSMKKLVDLKLVRDETPIFGISWLVLHPIDQSSPLLRFSLDTLIKKDVVVVVSFEGIEEILTQSVHEQKTYIAKDILEAKQFKDILSVNEEGQRVLNYNNFDIIEY
ncbi:MAG: hypothetical protein N4A33_03290 [Bacteriovoracaceae bacterium]|jgi:inward rectifier potassium channel|nr:hypothetical protein [Bacteriovoracaceae bacterium]